MYEILEKSDAYLLNKLFITDFIVWLQKAHVTEAQVEGCAQSLESCVVQLTRLSLDLPGLDELDAPPHGNVESEGDGSASAG